MKQLSPWPGARQLTSGRVDECHKEEEQGTQQAGGTHMEGS